jgi:hypothetical protein
MRPCLSVSTMPSRREALAELGRLRAAVAARIPAEPEILAAADDDDDDFRPHLMLWPSEAVQRFGQSIRSGTCAGPQASAGSTAIGGGH